MTTASLTLRSSVVYGTTAAAPMSSPSEIAVRNSPAAQSKFAPTRRKLARARPEQVIDFLQRRHPQKTAEAVAAETGIPSGTIKKWLERKSLPNAAAFVELITVYGPMLLAAATVDPPEWLSNQALAQRQRELQEQHDRIGAELARLGVRA